MLDLDDFQHAAATTDERHVLVVAGAGSGKTRTLQARIEHLLSKGEMPGSLFASTFTNRAAKEIEDRLGGAPVRNIGTLHSLALRLVVRPFYQLAGFSERPAVVDKDGSLGALREVVIEWNATHENQLPTTEKGLQPILDGISHAKSQMGRPEGGTGELFDGYNRYLRARNLIDFDDCLLVAVALLADHEAARLSVAGGLRHVIVDEWQDTNRPQVELVRLLASEGAGVFLVGDSDQSIYRFRGADPDNIATLKGIFPGLAVYRLPVTYRCPPEVVRVANGVIAANIEAFPGARAVLQARPDHPGGAVTTRWCRGLPRQGEAVARQVETLVASGVQPSNIACLYRSNYIPTVAGLGPALRRLGIDYNQLGDLELTAHSEVRDLLGFVLACTDAVRHEAELLRTIAKFSGPLGWGLGDKAVREMRERARLRGLPLVHGLPGLGKRDAAGRRGGDRLVDLLCDGHDRSIGGPHAFLGWALGALHFGSYLRAKGRASRYVEELSILAGRAEAEGCSLRDFIDDLALDGQAEAPTGGKVTLATVHAVKGCEWPHVFLLGVSDGIWPAPKSSDDDDDVAEERRLLYVALTRAKRGLMIFGSGERFLVEVEQHNRPRPALGAHRRALGIHRTEEAA